MAALLLALVLSTPPARPPAPPAGETAKLFFLAGDLAKAVDWAERGLKTEPLKCKPMLRALAEYGALANHTDDFTPEQAKAFLEWDRQIAPGTPGKLTVPVINHFVAVPLDKARAALKAGDPAAARALVAGALTVDPKNAAALALSRQLSAADAGR